ncbi:MAG: hypothetical protein ACXVJY_19760 [Ilumatobacteraceae bacterium]
MKRAVVLFALMAGCVDDHPSPNAGQVSSLLLTLRQPADTGTPMTPVMAQTATFDLTAVDEKGAAITHDLDVNLFLSFGGVKTGASGMCGSDDSGSLPVETIHLTGGQVLGHTVTLPQAFGATTLWIDDPASHATGASPTIYFRNPFVADIQTPPDVNAMNATFCSPFNGKFIIVDKPALPNGQLVVSSVFGNAFAVTDTSYGSWDKFNSMYVFSFGKPPTYIVAGKVLNSFSGNVSKFLGFTELNFPLFDATDDTVPLAQLPPPAVVTQPDLSNIPKLIALDAGVVSFTGKQCDPSPDNPSMDANIQKTIDQWNKFNEFVLDADTSCSALTNYAIQLPSKVFGTYDPLQSAGKMVTVVGMLRNNSGQNPVLDANNQPISCDASTPCTKGTCVEGQCVKNPFNFWTINPRTPTDIVVH